MTNLLNPQSSSRRRKCMSVLEHNRAESGATGVSDRAARRKNSERWRMYMPRGVGFALAVCCIGGCTTIGVDDSAHYSADRAADYPVQVVAARFAPEADVDVTNVDYPVLPRGYLPVNVEARASTSGKADGALKGAGRSALECGFESLEAGPYFPFIFVPCAILAVPAGAAIGAWEAAPKADAIAVKQASTGGIRTADYSVLVRSAHAYLAAMSERPVHIASGPEVARSTAAAERSDYPSHPSARGTRLELGLLNIRFEGSGKMDDPLCLHMAARGRKLDAATEKPLRELEHARIIECHAAVEWPEEDGVLFKMALENGQQMLAQRLVDQLYLIYRPTSRPSRPNAENRRIPPYVLAPIIPPAPATYLDLRSLTMKARHIQGWGGMHFVGVANLTPMLSWESFPRPFDLAAGEFSAVTYDLRLYAGEVLRLGVVEPTRLLHEWSGLVEPRHVLSTPLQPCAHYFWTVRARFTLNGVRRVTEWAGAYDTAGGEVAPSYEFYYPFRTPAAVGAVDCWR